MAKRGTSRTPGAALFERYLRLNHVEYAPEGEYERSSGARSWPDFRIVSASGLPVFCEVKDMHVREACPENGGSFDPTRAIRAEIDVARRQFRAYRDHPCVLVLHNVSDWEFRDRPTLVFLALLNKVARGRGSLVNTTLSAIAVVREFAPPNPAFERAYRTRTARHKPEGRKATLAKKIRSRLDLSRQISPRLEVQPRVAVFANPVARIKLPPDLFRGPCDTHYACTTDLGQVWRTFGGKLAPGDSLAAPGRFDLATELHRFRDALLRNGTRRPKKIVLFGSQARGTAKTSSDVDLLVVYPGDNSMADHSLTVRRQMNPDFPLDLLTRSEGELDRRIRRGDSFLTEIMDEGLVLYES
jgi:uncharacterized protein